MESNLDSTITSARRSSDMSFATAQGLIEAQSKRQEVQDISQALWYFNEAVNEITMNIPEQQRTLEDNLRIMRSYQHAINYATIFCDILIHHQVTLSMTGHPQDSAYDYKIIDMLKRLNGLIHFTVNYLKRGQKGCLDDYVDFYLAGSTALLEYYHKVAEWNLTRKFSAEIRDAYHQGEFSPVSFIKKFAADMLRDKAASQIDVLNVEQLRDLTRCYHSIANIYKDNHSLEECLAFAMLAIESNNAIPSASKEYNDFSKFLTIYVTLSYFADESNSLLDGITKIGYSFFGGGTARATPEKFYEIFEAVLASSDALAEQKLLLQLMHVLDDNYQRAEFSSKLQLALKDPSFHAGFKRRMDALESRIAANDTQEDHTPVKRFG